MNHSFNVEIAKKYGVDGAIIIEHLYFWIQKNKVNDKNFYDGRYWTYNSKKAFTDIFPYWTERQLERIIGNLKKDGAILTGNYNKVAYDRTTWYALDDSIISFYENGKIDSTVCVNGNPQSVEPIPYINTDINTDKKPNNIYSDFNKIIIAKYPGKKTKAIRDKKVPTLLKKYSIEELTRCIERYARDCRFKEKKYILNEGTFWNGRYEDYLDCNYEDEIGAGYGSVTEANITTTATTENVCNTTAHDDFFNGED